MTKGIQNKAKDLRAQAERYRLTADAPHTDPREAHEVSLAADRMIEEAGWLEEQAKQNGQLIDQAEALADELEKSPHQTALRKLALRDLQSAAAWLRRELYFQA